MATPFTPWQPFIWGSRGLHYFTGVEGVYMSHIFIPNGVRINLQGHAQSGQELLHVFHATVPVGPPSAADCVAVNALVANWVNTIYRPMYSNTCEADQVVTTGMNAVPAAQDTRSLGIVGLRVGEVNTSSITLSIKKATQVSGRSNRGRSFVWPFVTLDLLLPNADRVTDAFRTATTNVFNSLISQMQTGGYPLCIFSEADRAMHPVHHFVVVDDYIDSQRRRLLGRGR